jgi:hypothetical protein
MTIALESMAVEMPEVEGHPNRAGFRGVLTVVDMASQRAPSGSKGHRVMLTRAAAEAALPSLLGMALDYAPSFDRHDQRRKVGVITTAEIVGRNLEVGGFLYAKDFPEIVEEIAKGGRRPQETGLPTVAPRTRKDGAPTIIGCASRSGRRLWSDGARLRASLAAAVEEIRSLVRPARGSVRHVEAAGLGTGVLGMSYEVADVQVSDMRMRVWTLTRVTFTGAAILRRDKAAYEDTWIELA